ncbi:hypothetical protein L596_009401 [Steinernema carpocapsae]|uniref:Secreted protein n=1 Tax=Steinernema carpocapsae TaxID=34508 RepID=A0A4U5PFS2_STECR|nr:hypothetical protein L596_009401 [Steinernema carpocapsae]
MIVSIVSLGKALLTTRSWMSCVALAVPETPNSNNIVQLGGWAGYHRQLSIQHTPMYTQLSSTELVSKNDDQRRSTAYYDFPEA